MISQIATTCNSNLFLQLQLEEISNKSVLAEFVNNIYKYIRRQYLISISTFSSRMDLSSIEDTKKTYGYKPSRCQNCDEYFDPSFLPVHLNNCGPTTIQQEKEPSRCHNCDEYFDPSFLPVHLNSCEQTTQQQMKMKMSLKEDNKMRERKRCKNINEAIQKLREMVPANHNKKEMTKLKTILFAIDYIKYLSILVNDDHTQRNPGSKIHWDLFHSVPQMLLKCENTSDVIVK